MQASIVGKLEKLAARAEELGGLLTDPKILGDQARFRDLSRLKQPSFVKPADPLDRSFDAGGYFDALVAFLEHMVKSRLLSPENRALLSVEASIDAMFAALEREAAASGAKWLDRDLT